VFFFWFSPNSFHPIRKYQLCSLFYRWVSWIPQSTLTYLGTKPPAAWQPGSELRFVWDNACLFLTSCYLFFSWWLFIKIRIFSGERVSLPHGRSCPHSLSLCPQTFQEFPKRMKYEKMRMDHICRWYMKEGWKCHPWHGTD
jgi:hypothetical protein